MPLDFTFRSKDQFCFELMERQFESRWILMRIPNHLVPGLARQHEVDTKSRTFKPWSHVVSLIYAQLTHALGLNDVCDALRLNAGPLSAIRGATPPSKNALSHANRQRDPKMAEALFWQMLNHLQPIAPAFGGGTSELGGIGATIARRASELIGMPYPRV